jgi:hypothetical protein
MSDPLTPLAPLLSALRSLPFSILFGLAVAGYAVLFAPAFGGVDIATFRRQWGVAAWIDALTFTALSLAWIIDAAARAYWSHKKDAATRRVMRFVPLHHQCWWHLAKQQDDSYASQIRMDIQASNTSHHAIQIVKVRLVRPKAKILHALASLPMEGSPYHSHEHPVPPKGTATAAIHLMVRGALAAQGTPLRLTLGITDQYGEEYTLRNLTVGTHDPPLKRPTLSECAQRMASSFLGLFHLKHNAIESQSPIMPWTYDTGSESVSVTASILTEEKRNYAARGRPSGALGSLNVGLQSEPNHGWTTAGEIPSLLWEKGKAPPVTSPNLERLLRIGNALGESDKGNLERYLLAQLSKESPFAEVAYFAFLALHRMGRTIDALETARTFLAGDKLYAYSNLLGTLSAVVSREHSETDVNLYPLILDALDGDTEPDFRLREKINLARLAFLDRSNPEPAG